MRSHAERGPVWPLWFEVAASEAFLCCWLVRMQMFGGRLLVWPFDSQRFILWSVCQQVLHCVSITVTVWTGIETGTTCFQKMQFPHKGGLREHIYTFSPLFTCIDFVSQAQNLLHFLGRAQKWRLIFFDASPIYCKVIAGWNGSSHWSWGYLPQKRHKVGKVVVVWLGVSSFVFWPRPSTR